MTIVNENGQVTASYNKTHDLSVDIMKLLDSQNVQIGYGLLACALTMARLANPTKELSDTEEIGFLQAVLEFTSAYFPEEDNTKVH